MKLITETTFNTTSNVTSGDTYIAGVFMQSGIINNNRRLYPHNIIKREVDIYNNNFISANRSLGELGHPDTPDIILDRVSHKITEMSYIDGSDSDVYGKAKLLDTPFGNIAKALVAEGVVLGMSTRGTGTVDKSNIVQPNYKLCTVDIVSSPSAPAAFVNGIMEGREWVLVDGTVNEQIQDDLKVKINKDPKTAYANIFNYLDNALLNYKKGNDV